MLIYFLITSCSVHTTANFSILKTETFYDVSFKVLVLILKSGKIFFFHYLKLLLQKYRQGHPPCMDFSEGTKILPTLIHTRKSADLI